MCLSFSGLAPITICVLWPPGDTLGAFLDFFLSALDSLMAVLRKLIGSNASLNDFSGATFLRLTSDGISILTLSRSAYNPASYKRSSLAPGIALR